MSTIDSKSTSESYKIRERFQNTFSCPRAMHGSIKIMNDEGRGRDNRTHLRAERTHHLKRHYLGCTIRSHRNRPPPPRTAERGRTTEQQRAAVPLLDVACTRQSSMGSYSSKELEHDDAAAAAVAMTTTMSHHAPVRYR